MEAGRYGLPAFYDKVDDRVNPGRHVEVKLLSTASLRYAGAVLSGRKADTRTTALAAPERVPLQLLKLPPLDPQAFALPGTLDRAFLLSFDTRDAFGQCYRTAEVYQKAQDDEDAKVESTVREFLASSPDF
jgi:hypothetical protein